MEQEKNNIPEINIREVLRSKSPKIARILPGFVYSYINRIIHVEYINHLLHEYGHLRDLDFIREVIRDFNVTKIVRGEENLPARGRFIFACNHPLGGFDGVLLMDILGTHYKDLRFLVNDILMNLSPIKGLFAPINKHGAHSKEAAIQINEVLQSDMQILTFPSGLVSRKINGKITDLEWKKNFIQKAIEYQRDVIPVHFSGRNSEWFYFAAKLRKFLHIKWNLEMFYLPDETYKHRNKTVTVTFGQPVSWQTFDKSKTSRQWADYIREKVYEMADAGDVHNES